MQKRKGWPSLLRGLWFLLNFSNFSIDAERRTPRFVPCATCLGALYIICIKHEERICASLFRRLPCATVYRCTVYHAQADSIIQESYRRVLIQFRNEPGYMLILMQTKNRVPRASLSCIIISQGYSYKYFADLVCLRIINQSTLLLMLEVYFSSPKINKHPDKEGGETLPNTVQYPSSF